MTAHQYPSFPILQRKNNATSVGAWMSASRMRNCEHLMDSARLKTRVRLKTPRARTGRTTQRLTPRNERGLVTNHSPLREAIADQKSVSGCVGKATRTAFRTAARSI